MAIASANLNLMIKAAREAARGLVRDFGEVEQLQVAQKGPGDFVSKADHKAEEVIRDILCGGRPNYGWVGEESTAVTGADPTRRWIVDPLDGTTNFLHGQPHWCISIALEHKGQPVAAVVFDPLKDELFTAEKGSGAWFNDRRLRVSGRRDFSRMLLGCSAPAAGRDGLPEALADMAQIGPACGGLRIAGATALNLAYVAAGRFDGMWERSTRIWDLAAGLLLVREAGGFIEGIEEGSDPMQTGSIIAGCEAGYEKLTKILRK